MTCFNSMLEKDEAIKASTSSSGVEESFAGFTQSLKESRQKYEEDKAAWEKELQSANTTRDQAVNTSKELEKKLKIAITSKVEADVKLEEA